MYKTYSILMPSKDETRREYYVTVDGLFIYRDNMSAYKSVSNFVSDFDSDTLDFNECYGAYRISLNTPERRTISFSDNSGMMRYYINISNNQFYCSLAEAEKDIKKRIPNYPAIAQFLNYGCVYGNETIVRTVILSDPNLYYESRENGYQVKNKNLKAIAAYQSENLSLNHLITQAAAHCNGKVGCTITGGFDSRSVLANMISAKLQPDLAITGHDSHIDVNIARNIAAKTGLELAIISDSIDEESWLDYSVLAADGQDGICGIYRLNKLARFLQKKGIELQFGGVAGEMYKNSFINQDFPFYFGSPNWSRFYKYKVGTFDFDKSLFTKTMQEEIEKLPIIIMEWLKAHKGEKKAEAYLNAGYELMQYRCNHVINMFEKHTTIYNPLMERKMASYAYGKNPYKLEMQAFQRQEVSQHCEKIKNIKTDRGLTSDYNRKNVEFIKSYLFLVKVALQRLLFRNKEDIRIDSCFDIGHKNEAFYHAMNNVKELSILNNNTDINKLPVGLADRLFTIGLFFEL